MKRYTYCTAIIAKTSGKQEAWLMKHQPENTLLRRRESDGRPLAFDLFLSIERPLESLITPLSLIDHVDNLWTTV